MTLPTTHKIKRDYAKLDDEGKRNLLGTLVVRAEKRRVKFSASRSTKDGNDYARTRSDLAFVKTQMRLDGIS